MKILWPMPKAYPRFSQVVTRPQISYYTLPRKWHVCATFQCAYNPTCNPFKMLACCNDLYNWCVSFQIRMKTAEDFRKLIEGCSGDISADNALQVSLIRNGLVVHIYTNIMQQSIFKTAKMVAFIHEGVCGNINALKTSNTKAHEGNKKYEEAS